jgi:CBS domain-containing protein
MSKTRNVKDLMNPDVMTVPDDITTDALARYLTEREISGAPVVDSQGHVIGVVSMTDIGRNMGEPADIESSRSSDFYRDIAADLTLEDLGQRYVEERAVTVRDVMTPVVHQVPVTASAAEAVTADDRSAHSPVGRDRRQGAGGHCHEPGRVEGRRRTGLKKPTTLNLPPRPSGSRPRLRSLPPAIPMRCDDSGPLPHAP